MQKKEFNEQGSIRLDVWLSKQTEKSRSFIKNCCESNKVFINNRPVKVSRLLKPGDVVQYDLSEEPLLLTPSAIELDIVYEDESLIVINKPSGLTVHPGAGNKTETLVNALLYYNQSLSTFGGLDRPGIVHRLDKDTSGLLVVAKNNSIHEKLAAQFKSRLVKKKYVALLYGYLKEKSGTIELPIGRNPHNYKKFMVNLQKGRAAVTEYIVLKEANEKSLVDITLHTGRTHQIRVHFSYLNHPLVGDSLYGKQSAGKQLLHAYCLGFYHPLHKGWVEFKTNFPSWANLKSF
ncbi:MAG: RluA family pseudouridine synthase [Candidatus Margulisbacteria bacterium]|nr:RluA family pseudouridine synthase [Candidatus Margulisiibacteriota bacterium]